MLMTAICWNDVALLAAETQSIEVLLSFSATATKQLREVQETFSWNANTLRMMVSFCSHTSTQQQSNHCPWFSTYPEAFVLLIPSTHLSPTGKKKKKSVDVEEGFRGKWSDVSPFSVWQSVSRIKAADTQGSQRERRSWRRLSREIWEISATAQLQKEKFDTWCKKTHGAVLLCRFDPFTVLI